MKSLLTYILVMFCPVLLQSQNLTVSYTDATTAVNTLIGSNGITVSNATYTGAYLGATPQQLGLVSSGSSLIGFANGIILTTGNASFAQTTNTTNVGGHLPVSSAANADPDLQVLLSGVQYAPATLSFDFTTTGARPSFSYVFLSDEYNNLTLLN